ncbi:uncharacterized protein LOC128757216 [Synchiropus splendidus]|uniref:uncharacterized protein LOC128757216 n=1 Tax=Synchiropus splendidus TaxID=270530 RepID=UPI00237D55B5|nr:uncharacterized protein LOC128757216 [Synchiropus splendidus]
MGAFGWVSVSLLVLSLQTSLVASDCKITFATSSGPTSIRVQWEPYIGATNYFLDLRVRNNSNFAPVVGTLPGSKTQKDIQGLRPGTKYAVTLKVFQFYFMVCRYTTEASTVPATSQIVKAEALASTSISVQWTLVPSAEQYLLQVTSQQSGQVVEVMQTGVSAVIENLTPSTNYDCLVFTINHAGRGSPSKVRTVTTLTQPPLEVTVTQTGLSSAQIQWDPVSDVLLYRVNVRQVGASQSNTYNVSGTSLDVGGIMACSSYLISVSSYSKFLVPSEPTVSTYTTNSLTPVPEVTVDYQCFGNLATVHWVSVSGADSYRAVALSLSDGPQLTCTSSATSCQLEGVQCGQTYTIHVTPLSENCENMENVTSATFTSGNLTLLRDCSSEVVEFSWDRTNHTDHYLARAVDSQGEVQECLTEDNSCYFTHTVCGRHYYFSVLSIWDQCRSAVSATADIRTAPCIPQNLQTSADCNSNVLVSKWDLAEGALRYTVEAFGNRGHSHYNCSSLSNSCAMEGVQCGDFLTVYITAHDDECSSPRALGPTAGTVPCKPENTTAVRDCGADSVTVTWNMSWGAIFYVALVRDSSGTLHSCNSMDLMCQIVGLRCGTEYTAHVIASNFLCNSTESDSVIVETAQCPPDNVSASLDCEANEAVISWRELPDVNSYTASIVDEEQVLLSCSSTTTSCRVPHLKCGQTYTVTVRHHDGVCPSMASEPMQMASVPCGPQVAASIDCSAHALEIGWTTAAVAESFTALVSNGQSTRSYNTTAESLTVSQLECGTTYTLTVMSVSGECISRPSVVPVQEIPCLPTEVAAHTPCNGTSIEVSWASASGASKYQVTAYDQEGRRRSCDTNSTWCRLDAVSCGQVYEVVVSAGNSECSSNGTTALIVPTAPCPPTHLSAVINCTTNTALLAWVGSGNAEFYTASAVSSSQHQVACNTTTPGCMLDDLQCGEQYNVTVSSSDGECTTPCVVQDVVVSLNCSSNALTVSWMATSTPLNYSASAVAADGTILSCLTEHSHCTLLDLACGERYEVSVRAVCDTCRGPSSARHIVHTAPCVPDEVRSDVDCSSNSLHVSWGAASGAQSYVSTLTDMDGVVTSCSSSHLTCVFPNLPCARTYWLSVSARGDQCDGSESGGISVSTAPCDPTDVSVDLDCVSGAATVKWTQSAGAHFYMVVAETGTLSDSCRTSNTTCQLGALQCGENYTISVFAGDGDCNSSALARTTLSTGPCPPADLQPLLDCTLNTAVVSWRPDVNALSVTVTAKSELDDSATCSSTNHSCVLSQLQCGRVYHVNAVAHGALCHSNISKRLDIVTAPCTPAQVEHTYSCDTGIALMSWDDSLGRSGFHVDIVSQDHAMSCSTSDTYCSFTSLLCGHTYNASVTAVADHCNSSASTLTSIQTAPCAPANLSAALLCDNNTASVTWESSPGAESYKVLAQSHDGDVKHCVTSNTSCLLPNMHCSQTYLITVTPMSAQCRGIESPPLLYIAGPCPPTDVRLTMQCMGNIGHVTWSSVLRAEMYVAIATPVGIDGRVHECSTNGTGCSLSDLLCGETLSISVVTEERGCRSAPSPPFSFQSAVCPPMTVEGVTSCGTNDITVSWDASTRSPATYIIHAQKVGGAIATYSTSDTSQMIGGLVCGEAYALSVAVLDSECTSEPSDPIRTETAPCPPTNLTVQTECGTNLGIFSWSASLHAVSYMVDVTGPQGHAAYCSSNSTSCSVKLDCGRRYTATVIASSLTCNSSEGATVTFDSAPCLPDQVVASVQCSDNSMSVQWRGSAGELSYTAIAIGSDQSRLTCNTTGTNCTIPDLRCGLTYSIVVTTPNVNCGTIQGSDYQVQSAPCRPDTVHVDIWCSSNMAHVTWQNTGPDQTQVVTATDPRGVTTTCNSTGSNCTFDTLTCGETYTVSVAGHTETCSLASVTTASVSMAPCLATHVTATLDCNTGISVVMWDASRGAITYTVSANGSAGFNAECHSRDSYCDFLDLECGQEYSITVVGHGDVCTGPVSRAINLTTGPCPHSNLQTSLDCSTNTALVSWSPGRKILYYNATAAGFNVGHQESCSTSGAACNISGLLCGEAYKVTVSGQGQNCPSPAQDWTRINTGSASYRAIALDAEGHQLSCSTEGGSCNITGLMCGRCYKVYAVAVHETCESLRSELREINTAPCVPQEVVTHLDCLSGVVNITWNSSGFAPHFHVSVLNGNGEHLVSETDIHHCMLENLQCSHTYNVTVTTTDGSCNSEESAVTHLTTAPCPPPAFTSSLDCTTGIVSVTWSDSMVGVVYEVMAEDALGRRHHCNGSNSCDLTTLACGTHYNLSVTASRDGCAGRASPLQLIDTGPCPPHLSSVDIDCLTNSAWVMLGEASSGDSYVIIATDSRGLVQNFGCNSTLDGVCELPPLACSETFSFTAQASNHKCSSGPGNTVVMETGPCPPESVDKWISCENRSVSVSWAAVGGALSYTATLEQVDGDSYCCTVADTSCDIRNLPCGQMFVLLVSAEGRTCNSSQSDGDIVMTGPCVPQDLRSSLNCLDNVASMSWNHSRGGQLYRVTAINADGHVDQCTSYENHCELTGLQCGAVYNATVTAEDQVCQSESSQQVIIKTVPCSVTNVSSVVDCEGGSLTVSWSLGLGADSYVAKLQDSNGQSTTCTSQQGSCSVTGLSCGQVYRVSVVSSDGYCESPAIESTPAPPVPCPPRLVTAEMDCETGVAIVTWHPSDGAVSYVVTAMSSDHNETSISNSTHCDLHSLQCGRSYAVLVTAVGHVCNSVGLMTSPLLTEPCIPEGIQVQYSLTIGQVTWGQAAGADSYSVMGASESGSSASCSTTDTYCVLYDLSCSQMYTVNVSAHNQVCQRGSASLEAVSIETEPCPPTDVQTSLQCENNSAVVFWETSYGAVGYQVHLAGRDGHTLSCYTGEEFCKLDGLHCGGVYHTFVVAVGATLNSSESDTVLLTSGEQQ